MKKKRIVVKVGTNIITREDGSLDITQMSSLADQIAEVYNSGWEVIMVSSGAVACGRSMVQNIKEELDDLDQRQLFSAVGQAKLIDLYYTLFREHGITVGQVLTTKESLAGKKQMETQHNCMNVMMRNNIIPIINENDPISLTELMFTDNDELAGLVAKMMGADVLMLLTNVDGIFGAKPDGTLDMENLIREVRQGDDVACFVQNKKSSRGRGGMLSKESIAMKAAAAGIETFIANGRRHGVINALLTNCTETPSTHFIPERND